MNSKILLTAGSGPSYSKWPHWPTWTKLIPMLYQCNVIDASGPAAGNKFLYRSVLTKLNKITPDLLLVQWNFGKYDIYVENQTFINEIINGAGIRNFLIDMQTCKTTTGPGYWCSSTDNTVPWKKYYNENIKSTIGTALDDLEAMVGLQNLCAKKNIQYKFFTHDDVDHELLSTDKNTKYFYNELDWSLQAFDSIRSLYKKSESYRFDISGKTKEYHWVPNADFQYWFASEMLPSLLSSIGIIKKNTNNNKIKEYCHNKTIEFYEKFKRTE